MKPPFTDRPEAWTRTARTGQSRIDYACPVQQRRQEREDRWMLIAAAVVVVMFLLGVI